MLVIYVLVALFTAFVWLILVWPTDWLLALALVPVVASIAVFVAAVASASGAFKRRGTGVPNAYPNTEAL